MTGLKRHMDTKPQTGQGHATPAATIEVTPELVRQVARRVYAMLRRDMQLERERRLRPEPRNRHG